MQELTQRIFTHWNVLRIFRLIIGISILVSGVQSATWLIAGLGLMLTLQGVFDWGCGGACRGDDCAVNEKVLASPSKEKNHE